MSYYVGWSNASDLRNSQVIEVEEQQIGSGDEEMAKTTEQTSPTEKPKASKKDLWSHEETEMLIRLLGEQVEGLEAFQTNDQKWNAWADLVSLLCRHFQTFPSFVLLNRRMRPTD